MLWDILVYWTFFTVLHSSTSSLRVTVPSKHLIAVRGHPVVLGCEFTPDSDLSNVVVTWQRQENSQVVHSFYYQKDQLERQSVEYRNRTALFVPELEKGNASLRIEAVGHRDMGRYLCVVSTTGGTDKAELQLDYGAFYTEPRLSISVSPSKVMMLYEAEGYPIPEVRWLGDKGQNLSHHTELVNGTDRETGLYYLKSSYVTQTPALNVTFVLKNQLLNQDLQRPVNFSYADDSSVGAVITLAVVCVLLSIAVVFLTWLYWHKKK